MLYIELPIIFVIILLQYHYYLSTRIQLNKLKKFFPKDLESLIIWKLKIPLRILKNNDEEFQSFIHALNRSSDKLNEQVYENEETVEVELLILDEKKQKLHSEFNEVIQTTNAYLCKNKGTAADFNILQDTCERNIQRLDDSISNRINVPLYLGLGGTFIGIIVSLLGIVFTTSSNSFDFTNINGLLIGVSCAIGASLLGLLFTVRNSAVHYKKAVYQNDTDRNLYFSFLQRELLPILNVGMANSLASFKKVLDSFISRFGENIGEYHDSAALLNDNLAKQQLVLEEINKLSLTQTSSMFSQIFADLKDLSSQFEIFAKYQQSLNQNITKADNVVTGLNTTLDHYQNFNSNLEAISQNINSANELQTQLKNSLELHFPTIKDHKIVWREQADELNEDIKNVYKELTNYFKTSTQGIQEFINTNKSFFTEQKDTQNTIDTIVTLAKSQNKQYQTLSNEMKGLRNDLMGSRKTTADLNSDLIEAIKELTLKLAKLDKN